MSEPPAGTAGAAWRRGLRDALGLPCVVLTASMMGFGSLARDSGLGLGMALAASAGVWGLPGQVAMAELYAAGAGALTVVLAASLANARFLPMTVSFMPHLRGAVSRRAMFGLAQLISVNSWTAGLRAFPGLAPAQRAPYFCAFALAIMAAGLAGTALGYWAVDRLARPLTLGLIYLNPAYFALLFAGTRGRLGIGALLLGALAGPLFHRLSPDWGLLATGLVAGSAAFVLGRGWRQ